MRQPALAIIAALALAACAAPPPPPDPAAAALPAPPTATETAIARRRAEIAELGPRAAEDRAAAARIRRLEREIEQIETNAAAGETGRPAPQLRVRF